jgi:hypothetical protein
MVLMRSARPFVQRLIGLGQLVLDPSRQMRSKAWPRSIAVDPERSRGLVGKGDPVVGQHRVDLIQKCRDDATQERSSGHYIGRRMKLDVSELRHPVDRQEQAGLALG